MLVNVLHVLAPTVDLNCVCMYIYSSVNLAASHSVAVTMDYVYIAVSVASVITELPCLVRSNHTPSGVRNASITRVCHLCALQLCL